MKKYKFQIIIKFLISKLLLLLIFLNQIAFSKPLPPGSGAGDVKANILILLDTSKSMNNKPYSGDAVETIGDVVLLADGDILVGQSTANSGVVKYDYTTEKFDTDFAGGSKTFWGTTRDNCTVDGVQDTKIGNVSSMDINPDFGFGLDTTIAWDTPGSTKQEQVSALGDGACIKVMDSSTVCDYRMVAYMKEIAKKKKLKTQLEILPVGGTDTAGIQRMNPGGSIAGAISIPTRHIHQVIEMVHKEDVRGAIDLLRLSIETLHNYDWSFR